MMDIRKHMPGRGFFFGVLDRVLPGASSIHDYLADVEGRKHDRRLKRLEEFARRVNASIEEEAAAKVSPDLFEEIMRQAMEDEDVAKVRYYAAIIERVANESLEPFLVRMLGHIVKQLTAPELNFYIAEIHTRLNRDTGKGDRFPDVLQAAYRLRLAALGLQGPREVRVHGHNTATELGEELIKVCQLADQNL
jgi:hypothetical protein